MTDIRLMIGAPSLRGEDARDTLGDKLAGVVFPVTIAVTNLMPFAASFPGAGRLYLRPSGYEGNAGAFQISSADVFARFVSDVQAVAEMNATKEALEITIPGPPARSTRSKSDKAE